MKKFILLLLLALLIFIGWLLLTAKPAPAVGFDVPQREHPLVIAHADDTGQGLYPGNTLVFLQQMAALQVDVLEMDVHGTRDGQLVLMHDAEVDRTTDGNGAIRDKTLAELQQLNVAYNWSQDGKTYPYREQPQRIVTIDQVFSEFPRYPMIIELKTDDPQVAAALCEKLKQYQKSTQVIVSSFHQPAIDSFRDACPQVATGAGSSEVKWYALASKLHAFGLLSPQYQALHIPVEYKDIRLVSAGSVQAAQAHGVRTDVWTVNDEAQMRELIQMRVDGIMTDRPDRLFKVLQNM